MARAAYTLSLLKKQGCKDEKYLEFLEFLFEIRGAHFLASSEYFDRLFNALGHFPEAHERFDLVNHIAVHSESLHPRAAPFSFFISC